MLLLGFEERFMIVARDSVAEIVLHAGTLGKDHHHGEIFVALGAEGAKSLDVGDCHNILRISQGYGLVATLK